MLNRVGNFTDKLGTTSQNISDPTNASNGFASRLPGTAERCADLQRHPPSEISNISLALQAALPPPTTNATFLNYLANLPLRTRTNTVDVQIGLHAEFAQ